MLYERETDCACFCECERAFFSVLWERERKRELRREWLWRYVSSFFGDRVFRCVSVSLRFFYLCLCVVAAEAIAMSQHSWKSDVFSLRTGEDRGKNLLRSTGFRRMLPSGVNENWFKYGYKRYVFTKLALKTTLKGNKIIKPSFKKFNDIFEWSVHRSLMSQLNSNFI